MPNWCYNYLQLQHEDPSQLSRALEAFEAGSLLQEFVPMPADLLEGNKPLTTEQKVSNLAKYGYATWYDFRCEEWGTKWDISSEGQDPSIEGGVLAISFDSAWSPPIQFYSKLQRLGFKVLAYYYEPGEGFAGRFDEDGDESHDVRSNPANELPHDIWTEIVEPNWIEQEET